MKFKIFETEYEFNSESNESLEVILPGIDIYLHVGDYASYVYFHLQPILEDLDSNPLDKAGAYESDDMVGFFTFKSYKEIEKIIPVIEDFAVASLEYFENQIQKFSHLKPEIERYKAIKEII